MIQKGGCCNEYSIHRTIQISIEKNDNIFRPEHRHTYRSEEYIYQLSEELLIRTCYYEEEMDRFHIHASENILQNLDRGEI